VVSRDRHVLQKGVEDLFCRLWPVFWIQSEAAINNVSNPSRAFGGQGNHRWHNGGACALLVCDQRASRRGSGEQEEEGATEPPEISTTIHGLAKCLFWSHEGRRATGRNGGRAALEHRQTIVRENGPPAVDEVLGGGSVQHHVCWLDVQVECSGAVQIFQLS